jgi:hypothetical protein
MWHCATIKVESRPHLTQKSSWAWLIFVRVLLHICSNFPISWSYCKLYTIHRFNFSASFLLLLQFKTVVILWPHVPKLCWQILMTLPHHVCQIMEFQLVYNLMWPPDCWDCGFESRRRHGYLPWEFVLSGRDLCDRLITRPEESYRLSCISVLI